MAVLTGWRLSKLRYARSAFSGEGARLLGGRWNPPGIPMVYSSLSLSLAVLEVLVHVPPAALPDDWVSVSFRLEDASAEHIDETSLPKDWRRVGHPRLQRLGEEWVKSRRSLVLLVPSAIIEGEWNALLNPLHPQAPTVEYAEPKPFHFDERLFR